MLAFLTALLIHILLRSPANGWAMAAHLLLNGALVLLLVRHYAEGRQPLYWGHFDTAVVFLFLYLLANVYYSEVPSVSWRSGAVYLDGFSAYLIGRLYFYRRLSIFAVVFGVGLVGGFIAIRVLGQQLGAETQPDTFYLRRLATHRDLVAVVAAFWLATLPFLLMKRPTNLRVLVYLAAVVGIYSLYVAKSLSGLLASPDTVTEIASRQDRLQMIDTVWRIVKSHPLVGGGIGTFPNLYEAFKPSPRLPFEAASSGYLYMLAEIGLVGLVLLVYPLVRFPWYIIRHWGFFPNRKLRMGVLAFLLLIILMMFQGLFDPSVFSPLGTLILWTGFGILSSLVMIRDPARIFPANFEAAMRLAGADAGAAAKVDPALRRKRFGLEAGVELIVYVVLLAVLSVAQSAPYVVTRYASERPGEDRRAPTYGRRLEVATKAFPLLPELWVRLATYYQDKAATPIDLYQFMTPIETAYTKAITLDPFEPRSYERLALLHTSANNRAKAIDVLSRGVRNNPNDLVTRLLLVRELEKEGSFAIATYHVKQALFRIAPDQVELYLRLAELYERRGMRETAVRYFQQAQQVLPQKQLASPQVRRLRERLGLSSAARS